MNANLKSICDWSPISRLVTIVLLTFSATVAMGSVRSTTAVGFDPATSYRVNEFDAVNTFNGQLMVNVPLGPVYKSNGTLQYQFTLGHNRDPWDFMMHTSIDTAGNTVGFFAVDRVHVTRDLLFFTLSVDTVMYKLRTLTLDAPQDGGFGGTEAFPVGNAGMGWNVDFGTYGGVSSTETAYLTGRYTDASGTTHEFGPHLHSPQLNQANGSVSYTHDGSYLRLRKVGPVDREIDFPDGTLKRFRCVAGCTENQVTGLAQWNLQWIADPFGNVLKIQRDPEVRPAGGQWIWTLREASLGYDESRSPVYFTEGRDSIEGHVVRQHRLTFDIDRSYPKFPWTGERLRKAELAGPNGDFTMVYDFGYTATNILRYAVQPWTRDQLMYPYVGSGAQKRIEVQLLTSVTLPAGGGQWKFGYYEGQIDDEEAQSWCIGQNAPTGSCNPNNLYYGSRRAGLLKSAQAPTGGGFAYDYETRHFPARPCVVPVEPGPATDYAGGSVVGLKSRQELDAGANAIDGRVWKYSGNAYFRRFVDENHDNQDDGPTACRMPIEFLAAVLAPNSAANPPVARLTLNYYDVAYQHPGYENQCYGLPFTPHPDRVDAVIHRDGSHNPPRLCETNDTNTFPHNGRYLSSQIYEVSDVSTFRNGLESAVKRMFHDYRGSSDAPTTARLLRSEYVSYEASTIDCSNFEQANNCEEYNLRLAGSHTRFHDDDGDVTWRIGPGPNDLITERAYVETVYSDFDGLGHYRQTNTYGNLRTLQDNNSSGPAFWDHRVDYTGFNPGVSYNQGAAQPGTIVSPMPPATHPWVLGTYSRTAVFEGGAIGSKHYLFDDLRGTLKAARVLSIVRPAPEPAFGVSAEEPADVSTSGNDVLTVARRRAGTDAFEVVERTESYGGDAPPGDSLCVSGAECAWTVPPPWSGADVSLASGVKTDYISETTYRFGADCQNRISSLQRSTRPSAIRPAVFSECRPGQRASAFDHRRLGAHDLVHL